MIRRLGKTIRIAGRILPAHDIRTDHATGRPIGTATVTISAPRPHFVQPGAAVEVHAGWDGAAWSLFSGRIADDRSIFDDGGGMVGVECVGHASRLYYEMYQDLGFAGPMALDAFFRNLCSWRGVPNYLADATTAPDGMSNIMLGSNPDVNNGWIPLDKGTSPGEEIERYARFYGYRMFDTPRGTTRLKRISGMPTGNVADVPVYAEGVNVLSIERDRSYDDMANYWEVLGARYQAADTSEVAIRSIPSVVPFDPIFGPDGVRHRKVGPDERIVTETLARAARNAHEIDYSAPAQLWRWTTTGDPERQPGETVAVMSGMAAGWDGTDLTSELIRLLPRPVWLTRVVHTITDAGWTTDMEGWGGAGHLLPAGNDCVVHSMVGSAGVHIGNEWLSHYRNPNPASTQHDIPFTLPEDYSTATVRYIGHGTNSFVGNTESEASRFEIWHSSDTDRPSASGVMPRLPEDLELRIPYGETSGGSYTNRGWHQGVVPLKGQLKAGNNIFRIIAGEDRTVGDIDDYEIANAQLTVCGVGTPVIVP